ncbi:MAG: hypothetical protein KAI47_00460, partial [Deltaproteobacteria bacterium]|nr:hypothetical protein [Deltaproteobacteria bacterium]
SRPASVPVSKHPPGRKSRPAAALRGTLAVVNLGRPGARGWRMAAQIRQAFSAWSGGWARQPGIADHLEGKPQPEVLPSNESGRDLGEVLEKVREGGRPSTSPLWKLGRLLGVDYLLVVKVRTRGVSARLFSVHKQRWAPQGYEHTGHETAPLRAYVLDQVGRRASPGSKTKRAFWHKKWWVWVIGGALAAVTLGFALSNTDTSKGTLHITVSR